MAPKPVRMEIDGTVITGQPAGAGCWTLTSDAGIERAWAVSSAERSWVFHDGRVYVLETFPGRRGARGHSISNTLTAPMPATVRTVLVKVGDEVAEGETLVVLEAMKMELPLRAPKAGRIAEIRCTPGELVQPGVPLVDLA
jgi:3-methylcrotonyl-CoA carboxylase alpha subunit